MYQSVLTNLHTLFSADACAFGQRTDVLAGKVLPLIFPDNIKATESRALGQVELKEKRFTHCRHTVVTLLHYYFTVVTNLLHYCYTVLVRWAKRIVGQQCENSRRIVGKEWNISGTKVGQ
jgi:hypothetical protein